MGNDLPCDTRDLDFIKEYPKLEFKQDREIYPKFAFTITQLPGRKPGDHQFKVFYDSPKSPMSSFGPDQGNKGIRKDFPILFDKDAETVAWPGRWGNGVYTR